MSFIGTLKKSLGFEENRNNKRNVGVNDFTEEFYDETYTIVPEQSFYEIILIRPRTIADIAYISDQILEENNPVIVDLGFLERRGPVEFKNATRRIKILREQHNVEAILLAREEGKNLIILSPTQVQIIKKQ